MKDFFKIMFGKYSKPLCSHCGETMGKGIVLTINPNTMNARHEVWCFKCVAREFDKCK